MDGFLCLCCCLLFLSCFTSLLSSSFPFTSYTGDPTHRGLAAPLPVLVFLKNDQREHILPKCPQCQRRTAFLTCSNASQTGPPAPASSPRLYSHHHRRVAHLQGQLAQLFSTWIHVEDSPSSLVLWEALRAAMWLECPPYHNFSSLVWSARWGAEVMKMAMATAS